MRLGIRDVLGIGSIVEQQVFAKIFLMVGAIEDMSARRRV